MKVAEISGKAPKILLWGDIGCGKTALALTFGARAQVIDLDDGLLTGVTLKDKFYDERRKVDVKRFIESAPHKQATVFAAAKTAIFGIANDITAGRYDYDALIIDSLSSLAESAVAQIMFNSGKLGQQPAIQHWGIAFSEIKSVIAVTRALPIPVVLIAHEQVKTFGTGENQETKLEIAISGKNLASQIARYFDEIWYMRARPVGAGKYQYIIQTASDGTIPARSRANLPNLTDTSEGMWELLKKIGYTPPERKVKPAETATVSKP